MKRLAVSAFCATLWMSGCATPMRGGTSPSPNGPGTPIRQSPNLGESSQPPVTPELDESTQTLRRFESPLSQPEEPVPSQPSGNGPSLGDPSARRERLPLKSARMEAPSPRRQTSNYHPSVQFTGSQANLLHEPTWSRFYRSVDGRPIETIILGKGPRRIAVLASLHGDEPQSVGIVEELSRHLNAHPELLRGTSVLLVRDPNPDGLEGRTPYNLDGIDLNRNFPGDNWKPLRSRRAGDRSSSAKETQALVRILADYKPQVVLHIKDARSVGIVNYDGEARQVAEQVGDLSGLQVTRDLGKQTTGSIENFATSRLRCPSVTVLFPRDVDIPSAWNKHQDSVLAVIFPCGKSQMPNARKPAPQRDEPSDMTSETAREEDPFEPRVQRSSAGPRRTLPRRSHSVARPSMGMGDDGDFVPRTVPDKGYFELESPP